MRLRRLRFSLKMLLVVVALVALGSYWEMLPTIRARRFAKLIDSGELSAAEAMLPQSMSEASPHRRTIHNAVGASLQSMTLEQFIRGERRIIVTEEPYAFEDGTKSDQGLSGEYIVSRRSIAPSWHSFYQW